MCIEISLRSMSDCVGVKKMIGREKNWGCVFFHAGRLGSFDLCFWAKNGGGGLEIMDHRQSRWYEEGP